MNKNSFIAIFLLAMGLMLFAPILLQDDYGNFFSQIGFNLLILFTIYTLGRNLKALGLGISLVVPFIMLDTWSVFNSSLLVLTAAQMIMCIFLLYSIYYIANKVLKEPIIDTNLVFGAIMIYLLVGVLWSKFYWLTEVFNPDSFKGIEATHTFLSAFNHQFDFFYFSFTTMGTLGLGDISPTQNLAKALTAFQAIFGHLFLATVVAKLVSVWRRLPSKFTELSGPKKTNEKSRSLLVVFVLLMVIILITPSTFHGFYKNLILQTCFNLLIIVMVYTLSNEKLPLYLGIALAVPILGLDWVSFLYSSLTLMLINQALLCLFLIYATYYIAKKVLKEPIIDTNLIFGAILIYMLVGILWSKFFWLAEIIHPGSFKGVTPNLGDIPGTLQVGFDLFYYSFTTVAALGIGDITPTTHLGKSLTILEALFGQFFVATIIAKMVMVWRSDRESQQKEDHNKSLASLVEKIKHTH